MSAQSRHLTVPSLNARLVEGRRRAAQSDSPTLVSVAHEVTEPRDLLSLFGAADALGWHRAFWARPSQETWTVGVGQALTLTHNGDGGGAGERFAQVRRAHQAVMDSAVIEAPDLPGVGPASFGGFRFDTDGARSGRWRDYPDGLFVLPRFTVTHLPQGNWVTTNVLVEAEADLGAVEGLLAEEWAKLHSSLRTPAPEPAAIASDDEPSGRWLEAVGEALRRIERGGLDKVVLARQLRVNSARPIEPEAVLGHLATAYPRCLVFAVGVGPATFLGATPELLVGLDKGRVRATSLAGSAPRGATVEQDEVLAQTLLQGAKDQREHSYVVEAVRQALEGLCTDTRWDDAPSVTKLETVQHLATTFIATAPPGRHVLELVERLHPTPAVGGTPRSPALRVIRELERTDRGWYAGPIGRLDPSGDGEFGVAIRSALVHGSEALLYAGAGIVAGSDPEQELAETELKLAPLLSALARAR